MSDMQAERGRATQGLSQPGWLTERVDRYPFIHSGWDDGPWQDEPDLVVWRYKGLPCLIVRHPANGHLCGYVGVPNWCSAWRLPGGVTEDLRLDAYGGVTYVGPCPIPELTVDTPLYWWVGFDCAHYRDLCPGLMAQLKTLRIQVDPRPFPNLWGETYRAIGWVRRATEELADSVLRLPRRRFRRRIAAKYLARFKREARKALVRHAGQPMRWDAWSRRVPSSIRHDLRSLGLTVRLPRSLRA